MVGEYIKEEGIIGYRSKYTRETIDVCYAGLKYPEQHV